MNDERMIQLAVDEFERIGHAYPRRWLKKFGGIKLSAYDAPANLKREFTTARCQVDALLPKQDGEQLVIYTAHI